MAMGGSTSVTETGPQAAFRNPAGLAYVNKAAVNVTFRNLPETDSTLTGAFANPTQDASRRYGRSTLTGFSYATPIGRGVLGLSYHVGGFLQDDRTALALTDGPLTITNYQRTVKAQTDLFTLSYGQYRNGVSWGIGMQYANQYLRFDENYSVFDGGVQVGAVNQFASGNSRGFGVLAGVQIESGANTVIGASIRTPIGLTGNGQTQALYSRIPGRASLGFSTRRAAKQGSEDFWIYGAQADYIFGGTGGQGFERSAKIGFGLGAEYSLMRSGARWPLRVGFNRSPAQGRGFSDIDSFTFGLGYRPMDSKLGVDLSFGKDTKGGPVNAALGITYQVGR